MVAVASTWVLLLLLRQLSQIGCAEISHPTQIDLLSHLEGKV